jgi:hypothetical protein
MRSDEANARLVGRTKHLADLYLGGSDRA